MKRGQDDAELSPNKAEKMPKFITDALSDLPDDEFKLVLGFLDLESKQNLKLTSKDNEKRVMQLDPGMREWKLVFNDNNWDTLGISLSKARIRHTQDGTIKDIKLSLEFIEFQNKQLIYSIMFLMDSVINHWKNNIVSLMILLTGDENFLLDKTLVMPQLKHLNFKYSLDWIPDELYRREVTEIASVVLQNNSETLEDLELVHMDISLTESLKLKRFYGQEISYNLVADILRLSHETLETFVWQGDDQNPFNKAVDLNKKITGLSLLIKEFDVSNIDEDCVSVLVKAFHKTLEHFKYHSNSNYNQNHIDKPLLNLKTFHAQGVRLQYLVSVLRNSSQTLEELEWIDYDGDEGIPDEIQLKLKIFNAQEVSQDSITSVIKSSQKTLKDLTLIDIVHQREDDFYTDQQLQLERFEGKNLDINFAENVVRSSQTSLKQLILCHVTNDDYDYVNWPDDLQINYLYAKKMSLNNVDDLIKASQSSLEKLEIEEIDSYFLTELNHSKSKIKELRAKNISASLAALLIRYSHSTLEELNLSDIRYDEFDISSVKLSLQRFSGQSISLAILSSVLKSTERPFKLLNLKNIYSKVRMGDEPADVIDPLVLKSLIQFQNPICVLDI